MTLLFLLLASGISGTYQTCVAVAEDMKDEIAIYPIDSEISCAPQARAVKTSRYHGEIWRIFTRRNR